MKTFIIIAIAVLAFCPRMTYAQDPIEKEKIQYLIPSIENLKSAIFLRNGSVHDGKGAATHLRMKLQKAGEKVQTADDFIRLCASKSYISGTPYTIQYTNGETIKSEEFLRKKLMEYKPSVK